MESEHTGCKPCGQKAAQAVLAGAPPPSPCVAAACGASVTAVDSGTTSKIRARRIEHSQRPKSYLAGEVRAANPIALPERKQRTHQSIGVPVAADDGVVESGDGVVDGQEDQSTASEGEPASSTSGAPSHSTDEDRRVPEEYSCACRIWCAPIPKLAAGEKIKSESLQEPADSACYSSVVADNSHVLPNKIPAHWNCIDGTSRYSSRLIVLDLTGKLPQPIWMTITIQIDERNTLRGRPSFFPDPDTDGNPAETVGANSGYDKKTGTLTLRVKVTCPGRYVFRFTPPAVQWRKCRHLGWGYDGSITPERKATITADAGSFRCQTEFILRGLGSPPVEEQEKPARKPEKPPQERHQGVPSVPCDMDEVRKVAAASQNFRLKFKKSSKWKVRGARSGGRSAEQSYSAMTQQQARRAMNSGLSRGRMYQISSKDGRRHGWVELTLDLKVRINSVFLPEDCCCIYLDGIDADAALTINGTLTDADVMQDAAFGGMLSCMGLGESGAGSASGAAQETLASILRTAFEGPRLQAPSTSPPGGNTSLSPAARNAFQRATDAANKFAGLFKQIGLALFPFCMKLRRTPCEKLADRIQQSLNQLLSMRDNSPVGKLMSALDDAMFKAAEECAEEPMPMIRINGKDDFREAIVFSLMRATRVIERFQTHNRIYLGGKDKKGNPRTYDYDSTVIDAQRSFPPFPGEGERQSVNKSKYAVKSGTLLTIVDFPDAMETIVTPNDTGTLRQLLDLRVRVEMKRILTPETADSKTEQQTFDRLPHFASMLYEIMSRKRSVAVIQVGAGREFLSGEYSNTGNKEEDFGKGTDANAVPVGFIESTLAKKYLKGASDEELDALPAVLTRASVFPVAIQQKWKDATVKGGTKGIDRVTGRVLAANKGASSVIYVEGSDLPTKYDDPTLRSLLYDWKWEAKKELRARLDASTAPFGLRGVYCWWERIVHEFGHAVDFARGDAAYDIEAEITTKEYTYAHELAQVNKEDPEGDYEARKESAASRFKNWQSKDGEDGSKVISILGAAQYIRDYHGNALEPFAWPEQYRFAAKKYPVTTVNSRNGAWAEIINMLRNEAPALRDAGRPVRVQYGSDEEFLGPSAKEIEQAQKEINEWAKAANRTAWTATEEDALIMLRYMCS